MDLYIESISVHKATPANKAAGIIAVLLGCVFSLFAFLFFDWYTIFLVGIIFFVVYRVICAQAYEYEYILDESELSVFKIVNKSSRKKLISIPVEKMISFAPLVQEPTDGKVIRAAGEDVGVFLLRASDKNRTSLIFLPNEKMQKALQSILKRY